MNNISRNFRCCSQQDESLEPYKKCVDAIQSGLINPDLDYSSQEEGCESIVNNIQMLADKTEEADARAAQDAEDKDDEDDEEDDSEDTDDNQIRVVPSFQLNDAIANCRDNATSLYSP